MVPGSTRLIFVLMSMPAPANCQDCPNRLRSVLGCCQAHELDLVSGGKLHQHYTKGEVIFQYGRRAQGLFCISAGKVKLVKTDGEGREHVIGLAAPGDAMGYQALMVNSDYATSAVAMEDCVVCHIPKIDFLKVAERNAEFSFSLVRLLSSALSNTEERLMHLALKPVRERLADSLLLLYKTFKVEGQDSFNISISREDLASLVGTVRETVSRLLTEFKDEGLISTKGSNIGILNLIKLMKISAMQD